jgi:hypothetical protein
MKWTKDDRFMQLLRVLSDADLIQFTPDGCVRASDFLWDLKVKVDRLPDKDEDDE